MTRIMPRIALVAGVLLAGGAFAQAKDVTETRDLANFNRITIEKVGVSLEVRVGEAYSVTLEGAEKWLASVATTVENDALVIARKAKKKKSFDMDTEDKIIITMPKFTGLDVNGAVDAAISGIDSDAVTFEVNGAGNIEVSGRCGDLVVELNGAGNFEGEQLECKSVSVDISGAGNVEVFASEAVDLDIGGFGNIDVYGKPGKVKQDGSLFSNITIHE